MQGGLEGRVHICLSLSTQTVNVQIQRPLATIQKLLIGKTIDAALDYIPLLFSVCSQAQSFAALLAMQNALQLPEQLPLLKAQQQLVQLETQREHVLRILLDWSSWLDKQPNSSLIQQAMNIVPQARQAWFKDRKAFSLASQLVGTDADILEIWDSFLETHIFAMPLDEWSQLNTLKALQDWMDTQATVAAQMLFHLQQQHLASLGVNEFPMLAEVSVLKRQAHQPIIQDALVRYGNGVFTRYLARLVELVEPPVMNIAQQQVEAARGRLQHQVQVDAEGFITDYVIYAPTDLTFAAQGIAAQGLQTILQNAPPAELEPQVRLWIIALDPCVAYELEISHA